MYWWRRSPPRQRPRVPVAHGEWRSIVHACVSGPCRQHPPPPVRGTPLPHREPGAPEPGFRTGAGHMHCSAGVARCHRAEPMPSSGGLPSGGGTPAATDSSAMHGTRLYQLVCAIGTACTGQRRPHSPWPVPQGAQPYTGDHGSPVDSSPASVSAQWVR